MDKSILLDCINKNMSSRDIAKKHNISQSTVSYWIKKYGLKTNYIKLGNGISYKKINNINIDDIILNNIHVYNYLYGLYLGDGCVYKRKNRNVSTITFSLDTKYCKIIEKCKESIYMLFGKYPYVYHRKNSNGVDIKYTSIIVDKIFIKYGVGHKHLNKIYLPDVLLNNIDYKSLLTGLFHSDGSYYYNKNTNVNCYSFSNKSIDIINIISNCLDHFNIKYSLSKKFNNVYQIIIQSKRESEKLYKIIGDKND